MSLSAFWEVVRSAQLRVYQERNAVVDLSYAGWCGWLVAALLVAVIVVFLLSIFHVIPARRHVTGLLLGIGLAAAAVGFGVSWYHASRLPHVEAKLFRDPASARPASEEQKRAVVVLPLVTGAAALAVGVLGCSYMAVFWATSRQAK